MFEGRGLARIWAGTPLPKTSRATPFSQCKTRPTGCRQRLKGSIEGAVEPGCLASKGRGSASFRCLRDYSVPIGQRRGSGAGSREYPRPVLGSPATVGGLTSRRRESGARLRPRPLPGSPRPAPPLGAQAPWCLRPSRALPIARFSGPGPTPPRALPRTLRTQTRQTCVSRVSSARRRSQAFRCAVWGVWWLLHCRSLEPPPFQ